MSLKYGRTSAGGGAVPERVVAGGHHQGAPPLSPSTPSLSVSPSPSTPSTPSHALPADRRAHPPPHTRDHLTSLEHDQVRKEKFTEEEANVEVLNPRPSTLNHQP